MRISFSTLGCPDWSFEKIVRTASELGYDGVEVRFVGGSMDLLLVPELSPDSCERTRAFLKEMHVDVCCLASSVRFEDPDSSVRNEQIKIGMEFIDRAKLFQIPFVRVFGDRIQPGQSEESVVGWVADGLQRLGDHAQGKDVTVIIESHGDFSRSDILADVMTRVSSHHVGILWDTHHPWRFHGETPADTVASIGKWIRHTHWKDSKIDGRTLDSDTSAAARKAANEAHRSMTGHRHADYVLFGEGEFPIKETLAALKSIGYDGWCTFEWEKKWHPEIEDPEIAFPQFVERFGQLTR